MSKDFSSFSIIGPNVKIIRRRNAIIITALLLYPIVGLLFCPKPESFLNIFSVSLLILLLVLSEVYRKRTNPFITIGLLTFSDENITICDRSFSFNNITDVIITYGGYAGEEAALAPLGIGFIGSKEGGDNYLTIVTNDGEKLKYRFLSVCNYDFKNLSIIISEYQKKGINARIAKKSK